MSWQREIPDSEGYWLRINAAGRPQLHFVRKWEEQGFLAGTWTEEGSKELCIDWSPNDESAIISLKNARLQNWWWLKVPAAPEAGRPLEVHAAEDLEA